MASSPVDRVESHNTQGRVDLVERCDRAVLLTVASVGVLLPIAFGPRSDAFGYPKTLLAVVGAIVVLVVLAVRLSVGGLPSVSLMTIDGIAGTFVLLVAASWLLSADRHQSFFGERFLWQGVMATVVYATFYLAVRFAVTSYDLAVQLLEALVIGGLLVALYGWVQWLGWDPLWAEASAQRVFSTVGQPNALSAYLVMVFPIGLALSRQPSRVCRGIGFAAVPLSAGAIGATLSRGGVLGFAVATLVFGLISWQRWPGIRRGSIAAAVVVSVAIGSILMSGGSVLVDRLSMMPDVGSYESQQRLALWKVGASIVVDHPVTGAGPATYSLLFDEYRTEVLDRYWADVLADYRPESPHNLYLAIAAGSGLPALAAYLWIMGGVVRSAASSACRIASPEAWLHAGVAAAIVGYLTAATFMSAEITSSWTMWVLAGLGVTMVSSHGSKRRSTQR